MSLSADLWHDRPPVPAQQQRIIAFTNSLQINPSSLLIPICVIPLSHLRPLFTASMGLQLSTSWQSLGLYGVLLRTHPESDRPLTFTPPAWASSCCAMWSTFTKTPIPPALTTGRERAGEDTGWSCLIKLKHAGQRIRCSWWLNWCQEIVLKSYHSFYDKIEKKHINVG